MPTKAKRLSDLKPKPTPKPRGTTAERGYGYAWQKFARQYLRENPLCVECLKNGRTTAATCVDHVVPFKGNMDKFWGVDYSALCNPCHARKSANE